MHTRPWLMFMARISLVTSHSPYAKNLGTLEFSRLKSAIWLHPSGVGTMSSHARTPCGESTASMG